jgi:hypothetical protein
MDQAYGALRRVGRESPGLWVAGVGLCWIVDMGCRQCCGFVVAVNFCVMVVASWVSDLLLAWGAGRRHGVWSMGVAVWVAGMFGWESVGKKIMDFLIFL